MDVVMFFSELPAPYPLFFELWIGLGFLVLFTWAQNIRGRQLSDPKEFVMTVLSISLRIGV